MTQPFDFLSLYFKNTIPVARFKCSVYALAFANSSLFNEHMKLHPSTSYQSPPQEQQTSAQVQQCSAQTQFDMDVTYFSCEDCGFAFSTIPDLTSHQILAHLLSSRFSNLYTQNFTPIEKKK